MTNVESLRLLVVDDSPDDYAEVRRMLLQGSDRHYFFEYAETGREGLEKYRTFQPDCIVLDYNLPDMNATEVMQQLLGDDRLPLCPVVVLTGSSEREVGPAVLQSGAQDFVGKNWATPESMTRSIENARERYALSKELHNSEEQFRSTFEQAAVGIAHVALDGRILRINKRCAEIALSRCDQLLNESFSRIIHPEDREKEAAHRQLLLEGNWENFKLEVRCDCDCPRPVWLGLTVSLRVSADKQPLYFIAVVEDITTRRLAQDSVKESERRLADAQKFASIGSWVWTPETNHVWWSDAIFQIYGVSPDDVSPSFDSFLRLLHPEDRCVAISRVEAMLKGANEVANDLRLVRGDGKVIWIHSRARVIRNEQGNIVCVDGTDQDITKRIEAEADRDRLIEQVGQAQKMEAIGRLAGGVAHDFNNLLTVINGYCEMLMDINPKQDPSQEFLAAIKEASERATTLTSQLLAFSRKAMVEPKVIDLNQAVSATSRLLSRLIGEDIRLLTELAPVCQPIKADPGQLEQILLNLAVNARDAMPQGGTLRIATSYIESTNRLTNEWCDCSPGCYSQLVVSDNGLGMSPEVRARIFEPFFTTKDVGQGTGLGLATVYGIVRQADGYIDVETSRNGTTFRILFPAIAEAVEEQANSSFAPPRNGRETILIAEDEPNVRRLAKTALEHFGYDVLVAESSEHAVRSAITHSGPIHLLLSDVVMPEIAGRELANRIRKIHPGILVLFMSGYTDDALVRSGVESASELFIQKPFSPNSLGHKVREVLDARQSEP